MSRVRGLELLFNLEKTNIKSREDCVVAVFHCLMVNEGLQCVGIGDEWIDPSFWRPTELLPEGWNEDQDLYSLRYVTKDRASRTLLKIAKSDHMLIVNAVRNENVVASLNVCASAYISDNYSEYSTAYKDLECLVVLFSKDIIQKLDEDVRAKKKQSPKKPSLQGVNQPARPVPPRRPEPDLGGERDFRYPFPRIGGSDLDPFGGGGGGMFMDPSSFGVPARPTWPEFGVGGPGGLPRGSVPPGARFDPIRPPIQPPNRPRPDYFNPPEDDYYM